MVHGRAVFGATSAGWLELNFKWLGDPEAGSAAVRRLGEEITRAGLMTLPKDYPERYVRVRPEQWTDRVEDWISVLERVLLPTTGA